MATIVVVDGEHYPQVTKRAIDRIRETSDVVLAILAGGGEKLGQVELDLGVPVELASDDPEKALADAIDRHKATKVVDVSDEPVLDYVTRCRMASVAMWKGADYEGADFAFTAPRRPKLADVPSVTVLGTGKRTGKTALVGAAARAFDRNGLQPVIVAMGRGGPADPEVIEAGADLSPQKLMSLVEQGRHGASDHIEDAITSGVPTVGAWRAGGGLAGTPGFTNFDAAVHRAHELDPGIMIMEGSGASIPPVAADAGVLIVNAGIDPGHVSGYFGLFRLLLADLVVITMCEESIDPERLSALQRAIVSGSLNHPRVIQTIFRPYPLGDVQGRSVWYATTAPRQAGKLMTDHLEQTHGATVAGVSHSLADRETLRRELKGAQDVDVLLVELKAAAVDVVTRFGIDNNIEVVYADNRPLVTAGGSEPLDSDVLDSALLEVAGLARERFQG